MVKWEIVNKVLVVTPSSLLIPEFKALHDKNIELLKYVFLKCDISENNPFRSLAESDRNLKAQEYLKDVTLSSKDKENIKIACETYQELNKNSAQRFLKTIDDQLDQINTLLMTVVPSIQEGTDKNGNVVYATNTDIIIKLMEKIDLIQAKRESIEKRSIKESAKAKSKGNQERSSFSKGLIKMSL